MPSVSRVAATVTLLAIVLIAGLLRFHGLNWDDGHHLHPDERFLAIVADEVQLPSTASEYFDTDSSPLNPYNRGIDGFAYGTAPLFIVRALAEPLGMASYYEVNLVGRVLSALSDIGTVLLAFLLGRLVYGTAVGLLAAALLSVTVLHIQLSHFFTVDTFLAFFCMLALWAAHRAWLRGGVLSFAVLGLGLGLAAATKLSAALLLPIVGLAVLIPPPEGGIRRLGSRILGGLLCGIVALLVYRVAEPYSFAGASFLSFWPNEQRFTDLDRWVRISSGQIEAPFMIQWAGTPNPWFALRNLVSWGFGPPAGFAALAGLGLAAVQLLQWPRYGRNLLLVVWCAVNLGYFGFQFAKFMRYFVPVYPALAILAAYLLVRLSGPLAARFPPALRPGLRLTAPAVLVATALYALMFSTIYTRPNTRVEATDWIFANVPSGSTLAVEHWDDPLPLPVPAPPRRYATVSMDLYDDESPWKAADLAENLRRADYIVLSSERLLGSIPRLPERFPIAVEYYRLLLSGELGFDLVVQFDSSPSIGNVTLDDSSAQEDFTVYDHPTVRIFRKSSRFDGQGVAEMLAAVPLDSVEATSPVEAGQRQGLLLPSARWQTVQESGTWSASFALNAFTTRFSIPIWLVAFQVVALGSFPICWWLFPSLPDRGYGASKTIGLLLVSYLAWLAASVDLASFGRGLVLLGIAAVVVVGSVVVGRHRGRFRRDITTRWPTMLLVEAVFLAAFALMLGIRSLNPDLWHPTFGGEKPMDFAYLNAVIKSPSFPPYDPWFAGGYLNYYYFGFVLVAALTHLSAAPPSIAYNLAVATVFAITATTAFACGAALLDRGATEHPRGLARSVVGAGLLSAMALCLLGNLDGAIQLRDGLWRLGGDGLASVIPGLTGLSRALMGAIALVGGGTLEPFDFWTSTRFIGPEDPAPIHEFPFFTFLYGDLHAHMISLPLQVTTVLVCLQLVRSALPRLHLCDALRRGSGAFRESPDRGRQGPGSAGVPPAPVRDATGGGRDARAPRRAQGSALLALAALLIGTLRATNTWDLPLYLCLVGGAAVIATRPRTVREWFAAVGTGAIALVVVFGASAALFYPYLANYELFYSGVVPVKAVTDIRQFLAINGLLLFAFGGWLAFQLARTWSTVLNRRPRTVASTARYFSVAVPAVRTGTDLHVTTAIALLLACGVALSSAGRGTMAVILLLGIGAAVLGVLRRRSAEMLFLLLVGAAALGALLLPELVAVRGDVGRMNTVFKFYLQAWVLLALLAGPLIVFTARIAFRRPSRGSGPGRLWVVGVVFLGFCAAVYPVVATPIRLAERFEWLAPTLDGMAYMRRASHEEQGRDLELRSDYEAIRWMLEHVEGSPVVLEGQAPLYHWGSRFSIYTGLPTVLGWEWHQKQQRWGYQARVEQRRRDVQRAYDSPNVETARAVLRRYGVRYVVVGGLERAYYSATGLAKFEAMIGSDLEVAYRAGAVTIYRVRGP